MPATCSRRWLPVVERILGREDAYTLIARANLARWTGEAGDAAAARDRFAALLPVDERVFGPEDAYTLIARTSSLARPGRRGIRPLPVTCSPRCCP